MISKFINYKPKASELRKKGLTYGEIQEKIGVPIPKSTFNIWFKKFKLSNVAKKRLDLARSLKQKEAHLSALKAKKRIREEYLNNVRKRIDHLKNYLKDKNVAKIMLAMLYLGEGAKGSRRAFMLGNSDPKLVQLYLFLLRECYPIDESKFRCTLQCRADQSIAKLEKFWSDITQIPLSQFYKARIDPRTIGKKSRKPEYKGVCRIDYFSADIYTEIEKIIEIFC